MDIILEKIDEVYLKVHAERSIIQELADRLTFEVPGAKFQPAFKARFWDGKITLINRKNSYVYLGLEAEIIKFAKDFDYTIQPLNSDKEVLTDKILSYLRTLTKHEPRDYQISTLTACIESNRGVFLSPTGSGKSMIIYLLCRYLLGQGRRILIVVPTTALVYQMQSDFEDYNTGNPLDTACIVGGLEKDPETIQINCEDGNTYMFNGNQNIKLINNILKYKLAKDLNENDEIDDRWLQEHSK